MSAIKMIDEMAAYPLTCDTTEFNSHGINGVASGNFDDAYFIGVEDGRISIARDIKSRLVDGSALHDIINDFLIAPEHDTLASEEEGFDVQSYSGGNIDDAYLIGVEDGRLEFFREIMDWIFI